MKHLIYILLYLLLAGTITVNDARKANEAYERGDYEQAAELYRKALQRDPEDPRLHFNLANTLARAGQVDEAMELFEQFRSMSDDPIDQSLADYSIGNLMAQQQEMDRAAESFRDALRKNPGDEDAKHNYELARRQHEQQQEQSSEQDPGESDSDPDSGDQDQQQPPDQQPEPGDSPPEDSQQPGETQQDRSDDMTREEAEQVLDALEQRERDLLRDRQKPASEEPTDEKDW